MYVLFVDESGTPPTEASKKCNFFTLGGVIIRASDWHFVNKAYQGFKTRNKVFGEIKWRYFAPHNKDKLNPLLQSPRETRFALRDDFAKMIGGSSAITSVACVTKCDSAFRNPSVSCQSSFYAFCLKPLLERFQYFLLEQQVKGEERAVGMVIIDQRGRAEDFDLRHRISSLSQGSRTFESKFDRIIENIAFQDSEYSIGIQLADFVAGATHRSFDRGDPFVFELIKPSFRRSKQTGEVEGFGLVRHPKTEFERDAGRGRSPDAIG